MAAEGGAGDGRSLVVAMTGATGAIYGIRTLEALRDAGFESHLIVSRWAETTIAAETDRRPAEVRALADHVWGEHDLDAPPGSPELSTRGMVVVPCSMKSLAAIAHGIGENLIHRSAAVTLERGRRLVLLVRESPLSVIHLENMLEVARAGALVMPPVPAFYARPRTLDEMVDHTVGRLLDHFGIEHDLVRRWGERRGGGAGAERA